MSSSHPHWLRSAIIAAVGLIIALLSVLWVGIAIRSVGPKTISLVYRIEEKTTLAFIRSTEEGKLLETIDKVRHLFPPEARTDLPSLPKGVSYEYALLSGSGSQHWIVVVHTRNQEQVIFESSAEARSFLLPIDRIGASIGAGKFFRAHGGQKSSDCTFIDLKRTGLADEKEPVFIRLALSLFSHALILEEEKDEQKLILKKQDPSLPMLSGVAPAIVGAGNDRPLFALSIGHPSLLLSALQKIGEGTESGLAEGLLGILQFRLKSVTQSSDIEQAVDDLARNGLGILLMPKEKGLALLLMMKGKSDKAVDDWFERMQSAAAPTVIRTQKFLHGNNRTDVIRAPLQARESTGNDWTLVTVNSGSRLPLSFALRDAMLLLSNDKALLPSGMRSIDDAASDQNSASMRGTVDIDWLLNTLQRSSRLLPSLLAHTATHVTWEAEDTGDDVRVKYSITKR